MMEIKNGLLIFGTFRLVADELIGFDYNNCMLYLIFKNYHFHVSSFNYQATKHELKLLEELLYENIKGHPITDRKAVADQINDQNT